MKEKRFYHHRYLLVFILILLPFLPIHADATSTSTGSDYKQVSNQVLVSPYNMEGKTGWYVCTTNCEAWGLKKGEWHKHLDAFKFEGHLPIAPVEVYKTNKEGEAVQKIETKPSLDQEALKKEGYKQGLEMGNKDGYDEKIYNDELKEAQEFVIQGFKEGYKQGYNKGQKAKESLMNEETIKKLGNEDGYTSYRYGGKKDYLSSKQKEYVSMPVYQKAFDQGWNQAQQEFHQKYPFMKWFEWNYQGITILHILGVGLLLLAYAVIKIRKAKKKKLEDVLYTSTKKDEKESKRKRK